MISIFSWDVLLYSISTGSFSIGSSVIVFDCSLSDFSSTFVSSSTFSDVPSELHADLPSKRSFFSFTSSTQQSFKTSHVSSFEELFAISSDDVSSAVFDSNSSRFSSFRGDFSFNSSQLFFVNSSMFSVALMMSIGSVIWSSILFVSGVDSVLFVSDVDFVLFVSDVDSVLFVSDRPSLSYKNIIQLFR